MNKPQGTGQWTPGPWVVAPDCHRPGVPTIETAGRTLRIGRTFGGLPAGQEQANAQLMAAAPRLYVALAHLVGFLELLGHADLVCAIEGRAALLEATGEDAPAIQSPTPQQESKKGTQGGQSSEE